MKPYNAVEVTVRVGNRSVKDGEVTWEDSAVETELLTYTVPPRSTTIVWMEIDAAVGYAWRKIADVRKVP